MNEFKALLEFEHAKTRVYDDEVIDTRGKKIILQCDEIDEKERAKFWEHRNEKTRFRGDWITERKNDAL